MLRSSHISARRLATAGTLAMLFAPARAVAQPEPSPAVLSVARDEFRHGVAAAHAEHWDEAIRAFTRSFELYPNPLTLFDLASAQMNGGRLVASAENYRRFIHIATSGAASAQRGAAQHTLESLEPRIPRVRIQVDGLAHGDEVRIGDDVVPADVLGLPYPVDPGHHVLTVTRSDHEVARAEFDAAESSSQDVRVATHEPAPEPPHETVVASASPAPAPIEPAATPAPAPTTESSGSVAPYVSFAFGAAGFIAAGVFFALRTSNQSQLNAMCTAGSMGQEICPDTMQTRGLYSSAHTDVILTDVALGVGAAAVVAGGVLWLLGRRSTSHAQVAIDVRSGGAGVTFGANF